MATFVPATSVTRADLILNEFGQEVVNTLWVHWLVPITTALLTSIADNTRDWFIANLLPILSQRLTGTTVRVTDQSYESAPSIVKTYTPNSGGIAEATGVPSNVALAVKFGTESRGRSFRGRNFLAGIPVSAFVTGDADSVTSAFISSVISKYSLFEPNYMQPLDGGAQHVVTSHFHNGAPRGAAVSTPVMSYTINTELDSMRRRLRSRGA